MLKIHARKEFQVLLGVDDKVMNQLQQDLKTEFMKLIMSQLRHWFDVAKHAALYNANKAFPR